MKLHWRMPDDMRPHYENEVAASRAARSKGELQVEWRHLERAHVLGQRWPREHNAVHWRMLMFGFRIKNTREVLGQLPRLLIGGVKSFVGTVPIGNTGGADVPALKPMELPHDLRIVLEKASVR